MIRTLIALLASVAAWPALAQDGPSSAPLPGPEDIANRNIVTIAAAVAMVPDYEGSDDYRMIPARNVIRLLALIAVISQYEV